MSPTKKKTKNYVNNADFFEALTRHQEARKSAIEANIIEPRIPKYIAECIMKIATHLGYRYNFGRYPFKDEMILDGIENALNAVKNFDPNNAKKNAFGYFNKIIWWAFVRRIQKEKEYLYTKLAMTRRANLTRMTSAHQADDESREITIDSGEWTEQHMSEFMEDFETKRGIKKTRTRRKKTVESTEEKPK